MPLIFLGPPGAGKSTQGKILAQQGPIVHISTGELLRKQIVAQTPLGKEAQPYVETGQWVPDYLIMEIMRKRLKESDIKLGWILEGFPRTVAQAQSLDKILSSLNQPHPQVVYFHTDTSLVIQRLLNRGRQDDNERIILRHLQFYQRQIIPLVGFYQKQKRLVSVDGNQSINEVTSSLYSALQFSVLV